MQRLAVVILEHVRRDERHLDWLMERPGPSSRNQRLWAARLPLVWPPTPADSTRRRVATLTPIAPHRRRYLTFQGDLTDRRGRVRRLDAGWAVPLCWSHHGFNVQLNLGRWRGRVQVERLGPTWRARFAPTRKAPPR